jgi:protein-L-isoaspartate O-methyltransferase
MTVVQVSGTEGYAEDADRFTKKVESISFADIHARILHLIPTVPVRVLDIGAGSGRDAAAFAAMGHDVVAVEPIAELRDRAACSHLSPKIEWLDDSLPLLAHLDGRGETFDVVMLTAVWMHLDQQQRQEGMPRVSSLLKRGGVMIFSLRHGPIPSGRRMFDVSAEETIDLAESEGLRLSLKLTNQPSAFPRAEVTWTRLAFAK